MRFPNSFASQMFAISAKVTDLGDQRLYWSTQLRSNGKASHQPGYSKHECVLTLQRGRKVWIMKQLLLQSDYPWPQCRFQHKITCWRACVTQHRKITFLFSLDGSQFRTLQEVRFDSCKPLWNKLIHHVPCSAGHTKKFRQHTIQSVQRCQWWKSNRRRERIKNRKWKWKSIQHHRHSTIITKNYLMNQMTKHFYFFFH